MADAKENVKAENAAEEQKASAQEAPAKESTPGAGSTREAVEWDHSESTLMGVKAGMTQVYDENGNSFAVTVIDLQPNVVTQLKTKEKNGYQAVQVGLFEKKEKSANKAEQGHAKKAGAKGFHHYKEFRLLDGQKLEGIEVGKVLSAGFLKDGDLVDLTSVSKGKGFQGVMKRHNFAGGPGSHGASITHRMPGSIGNCADPAKVWKGKKMAGQMGNKKVTVQNIKVVRVDLEKNLLLVNGSVPGAKSSVVTIRKAVKA